MGGLVAIKTTDVSDKYGDRVQVAEGIFRNYGGKRSFEGTIVTVKVHEDNILVHEAIQERGDGKVLVVDGGGSLRTALVGDHLAGRALESGYAGLIIFGAVRDTAEVAAIPIGVKALNTSPKRPAKNREGQRNIPVTFAGVTFKPGNYVYADEDGIVVAENALPME